MLLINLFYLFYARYLAVTKKKEIVSKGIMNEFSPNHVQMQNYEFLTDCRVIPTPVEACGYDGLASFPGPPQTSLPSLEKSFLNSIKKVEAQTKQGFDNNSAENQSNFNFSTCDRYQDLNNNFENGFPSYDPCQEPNDYCTQIAGNQHARGPEYDLPPVLLNPQSVSVDSSRSFQNSVSNLGGFASSEMYSRNCETNCDAVVSKSSLSSLESLASSISAVPILDPDFFNLSKERKCGGKSSRLMKCKSLQIKRRKNLARNETDLSKGAQKETNLQSHKSEIVQKEPSSLDNRTFSTEYKLELPGQPAPFLASDREKPVCDSQKEQPTNHGWLCQASTNNTDLCEVPSMPLALAFLDTKDKQWSSDGSVFTDLNKITQTVAKSKFVL